MSANSNIIQKQANPFYASVADSPHGEKEEQRKEWEEKYLKLPRYARYGLISKAAEEEILRLASQFGLKDAINLGRVSRLVRQYFLGGLKGQRLESAVKKELNLSGEKLRNFADNFKNVLRLVQETGKKQALKDLRQVSLREMIQNEERIVYEQTIGNGDINIEEEKAEPSIANWIKDYKLQVGAGNENVLKRSDYLYNSPNAKRLNKRDRNKLSVLLDYYDNKKKVFYNTLYEEIDFDFMLEISNDSDQSSSGSEKVAEGYDIKSVQNKPFFDADKASSEERKIKKTESGKIEKKEKMNTEKNTLNLNDYT
ncbi:MAG: hypothetical protein U5L10_00225 [Candidatus Moranbacteria bacterium]|nr:hypothetical protein [Candidatus Moranbacteria bacterium]